ncbi:FAD binding domain-containing protein [Paucibacter sp. KCTC 42545]|uniref:FAD binding domain-containing protein n=1 Tax=Paucibacter sp. KCTC 42545 TaxID=1768242 RepID=UPI000733C493|nr:xanthine dehydrogenase family protein subunit M [Paucibacter sp. KCTC 42545]ALT78968.1 hypothetical protein AT984_19015 [Paucibacter sp. KCTC 42545]
MQDFEYCRAASVEQVQAWLRDGVDSKLLAGGQSLLGAMKLGLMSTERLIDLQDLAALRGCSAPARGELLLGAMQSHASLARHEVLKQFAPGLAHLASHIADEQVRSQGTLGGSLANADPAACWPAGMLALNATLVTDRREIAADDFFTGFFGTALEPDELLCRVQLRRPRRFAYAKFEQAASRFALVGVAVAQWDDGSVCVALTGSANGVLRLPEFEQALNREFSPQALRGLSVDEALMSSDVHGEADYRAHLAGVLAARVVQQALEMKHDD